MVIYEKNFWLCFGQKILTEIKQIVLDNNYKRLYSEVSTYPAR